MINSIYQPSKAKYKATSEPSTPPSSVSGDSSIHIEMNSESEDSLMDYDKLLDDVDNPYHQSDSGDERSDLMSEHKERATSWLAKISTPRFVVPAFFMVLSCVLLASLSTDAETNRYVRSPGGSNIDLLHDRTAMLGRVINIIYLQNGIYSFERNLSTSMILNDMFGIPNIPMPSDQKISDMISFINSIRSLPDVEGSFLNNNREKLQSWDVPEVFNFYGIQEKSVIDKELEKLEKLNSLKLSNYFISKDLSDLPSKIEDLKKNGSSTEVQQALENIKGSISRIKEDMGPWIQVVAGTCTSDELLKDAMEPLIKYGEFFTEQKDILESLESFLEKNNNTLLQLDGIVSSEDFKTPLRTSKSLASITNAIYFHDPSESKYLPAFPRGIKDSEGIWDSFSDPWMMETLNQKKSLDTLRESLRPVMELMRQILDIDKVWTDKKKEDMIEGIGKELKILSDLDSIHKSSTVDYKSLMTVARKWKQIHDETSLFKLPSRKVFDEFLSQRKIIFDKYGKIFNSTEFKTFSDSETFENLVEDVSHNSNRTQEILENGMTTIFNPMKSHAAHVLKEVNNLSKDENLENFKKILARFVQIPRIDFKEKIPEFMKSLHLRSPEKDQLKQSLGFLNVLETAKSLSTEPSPFYADIKKLHQDFSNLEAYLADWRIGFGWVLPHEGLTMLPKLKSAKPLAFKLGYAQRAIGGLSGLDRAIQVLTDDGPVVDRAVEDPKSSWVNSTTMLKFLKKFQSDVSPLKKEISVPNTLEQYASIFRSLDSISPPTLNFRGIQKTLKKTSKGSKMKPSQKASITRMMDVMEQLQGLEFVKLSKEGNTEDLLASIEEFFEEFFGRKEEPSYILLIVLTLLLLVHIVPAGWFYRHELYIIWYISQSKRAQSKRAAPSTQKTTKPSVNKTRAVGGKDIKKEIERPPPPQKVWVPFTAKKFKEEPNVLYDSDDLRSIGTSTLSTQSDASDYLPSTRSDRTMWPETEDSGDMVYPEEKPENFEVLRDVRAAYINSNILEFTGFDEETYFFEDQRYLKEKWEYEKKVQDAEEVAANGGITQRERDQKVYAAWDRLLAFDAKEILYKNTNNKEIVRVMVIMENMDQKELEVEKKSRTGIENVTLYVEESFVGCPEEELEIAKIAWISVDRIDNYIHASYQDKWDHIYRCYSPRHCHDWCRVRMSSDAVDDIDFYDACWVYPWLDLYHKVYKKFKNKLICAASPLHNCTVGVLWHWLYENKVKFMLVLDKQLERNLQSSADWFPKKVGEVLKVRRNREREYFIRCVKARRHPDGNGVERKFIITYSRFRQRVHARSIKILFMDDWDQDSMPEKWQLYIVLCERIAVSSVEYPVVVMSKHGSGRAMTVILSVMAAIMAHYDNDVGIHSMVQSGRASKRQAIVVFNQVYIWRQLHYDLLFLWYQQIRQFRTEMQYRLYMYGQERDKHHASFVEYQRYGMWYKYYQYEVQRYERFWAYIEYYQSWDLGMAYRERWIQEKRNGQTETTKMMQAYEKKPKRTAAYFYDNETPVRRRWLRKDDEKRDKKRKATGYVEKKDHTFAESAACERYDFLIPQHRLKGRTHFTNKEDIERRRKLGAEYVDTWTLCLDKENQKGIIKPEDRIALPWRPKVE
ncbi:unnamed protein product [Caenorhabditis nigoni]